MSIPFSDTSEVGDLGTAAYLRILETKNEYQGALFIINSRGEPMEFTHNLVEVPNSFLWRKVDVKKHATRKIVTSLLAACPQSPAIIFCLAEEVDNEIFCQDIRLSMPVCRVAPTNALAQNGEIRDNTSSSMGLLWFPAKPGEGTIELKLFLKLFAGSLLTEPFERAATGLKEVYKKT